MIYKEFQGSKLSALGLGAMRLPVIDGNDGMIDEGAVTRMVDHAFAQGINYYDMLLELYNEHNFTGGGFIAPMALMAVPQEKHPTACVGCRSCEAVCPQQIKISEALADFSQKL